MKEDQRGSGRGLSLKGTGQTITPYAALWHVLVAKMSQASRFFVNLLGANFSTNNKIPEADIGVQPEDQKSKAAKPLENSNLYGIFILKEREFLSFLALYSFLLLGLKCCQASMAS